MMMITLLLNALSTFGLAWTVVAGGPLWVTIPLAGLVAFNWWNYFARLRGDRVSRRLTGNYTQAERERMVDVAEALLFVSETLVDRRGAEDRAFAVEALRLASEVAHDLACELEVEK